MDATELLAGVRLVPVLVLPDATRAVQLAHTLHEVGFRALEITLRTDAALDSIARIASALPDLQVGAGSVRLPKHVDEAVAAGARFLVSPGMTPALLDAVTRARVPFVPGAATASELMRGLDAGYRLQKFFPAEISGGAPALRALSAPLPEVRFFPTGGITAEKLGAYLALPTVACIGGSWFVSGEALERGAWETIAADAASAMAAVRG